MSADGSDLVSVEGIVAFCLSLTTFPLRGNQRDDLLPGLRTIGLELSRALTRGD